MKILGVKEVKLSNGEVYSYRETGSGEKTLLLIHGNLVSSRHWGELLIELGKKYRVLALDLRGAGVSTYNKPIESFKDWVDDIKLFCDELELKDFTLLGWSMGGGISQRFAVDYPQYVQKLILLESIPCSGYPYHKKDENGQFLPECYENRQDLMEDKLQLKPMIDGLEQNNREYMKSLWDMLVFNVVKPEENEYSELIDDIYKTRNLRDAAWAAHIFNISHSFNGVTPGTGEIDNINVPVMIMVGDSDLIVPKQLSEFTASEIGENTVLEVLPNCGHTPHYDNLSLVVQKISNFMDRN